MDEHEAEAIYDDEYDPDWEMPELTPAQRDAMPPRVVAYVKFPDGTMAEITIDGWGRTHSSDPRVRTEGGQSNVTNRHHG